jgi:hypothetical protein
MNIQPLVFSHFNLVPWHFFGTSCSLIDSEALKRGQSGAVRKSRDQFFGHFGPPPPCDQE